MMKGKKLLLSKLLLSSRLLPVFNLLAGERLVVFNYHRIRNENRGVQTEFDDEVFGPTVLLFRQQMEWLKNNTELVSEADVIKRLQDGSGFSRPSAMVTFDDGYVDNYHLAYPVLKELQVPAIFFIPTGHINSRQLGWWDIISYLVNRSVQPSIWLDGTETSLVDKDVAKHELFARMKTESCDRTNNLLLRLAVSCGVPLPPIEQQGRELMSWDQIREVSAGGISIGSHTDTHRVLATLPLDQQRHEMRISKEILEQKVGVTVNSISYPVGSYACFSEESMCLVAECGYSLGFSYHTGINSGPKLNPQNIKRVGPPESLEHFAVKTLLPASFSY
jgi:peptidoglycan/xylan/chitin deacetylase (PgdA/CDA1 family)